MENDICMARIHFPVFNTVEKLEYIALCALVLILTYHIRVQNTGLTQAQATPSSKQNHVQCMV